MRYTLIYCSALAIFALTDPTGFCKPFPEQELRERMNGDEVLLRWVDFTKAHPDVYVDYEMLPS